jgi:N-acetylmuramic acid 6-phosphate etherase
MREREVTDKDVVVGISAGGTTPYVQGAIAEARQRGATTVFMACVPVSQVPGQADIEIRLLVGPEVLAGSTRLKAGTVTKLVLNILSTSVMVKLGKVYGNRMVDVSVTNQKLRDRAIRTLVDLTELPRTEAESLLDCCDQRVKLALLVHWSGVSVAEGRSRLEAAGGHLRRALEPSQA